MITAIVPTDKVKTDWRDQIKTQGDWIYLNNSGLAYVLHPDFPSWKEFVEYLEDKEKNVE